MTFITVSYFIYCLSGKEHANPDELADNLKFTFTHLGLFQSNDGSDITAECFLEYNNNFFLETVAAAQTANFLIANGTLCQGKELALTPAIASLSLVGTQVHHVTYSYILELGIFLMKIGPLIKDV